MTEHLPLVLLHGWGTTSRVWSPFLECWRQSGKGDVLTIDLPGFGTAYHEQLHNLDQLLDYIAAKMPPRAYLCGWSLGGMLAVQLAARFPARIALLCTLASNAVFVEDKSNDKTRWPGITREVFSDFCARFSAHAESCWRHFLLLQNKNNSNKCAEDQLKKLCDFSDIHPQTALKALTILGEIDNRAALKKTPVRSLHILASNDALVPISCVPFFRELNENQQIDIMSSSHVLPLSQPELLAEKIRTFIASTASEKNVHEDERYRVDKKNIRRSFGKAAASYDRFAILQREVGTQLLSQMNFETPQKILDVGCGTGFISRHFYQENNVVLALDIATDMLLYARQQHGEKIIWLQGDMERLPLADNSVDVLVSNLALQWASDVPRCFVQWRRVLCAGGQLFFSTFLPSTLHELEKSWQAADDRVHVNHFMAADFLQQCLQDAGFHTVKTNQISYVKHYPDMFELVRELKAIGAHNMNAGQPAGLTGKQHWQHAQVAYEQFRELDGLPATYAVFYVSAVC